MTPSLRTGTSLLLLCLASCAHTPPAEPTEPIEPAMPAPDDTAGLLALLQGEGLPGWIHGAIPERRLFVFTYRKPGDFFAAAEFPALPATDAVRAELSQLKRHDRVRIRGSFVQHGSPQRHILVTRVKVLEPYRSPHPEPAARPPDLAALHALPQEGSLIGKVHAVADGGAILVIEHAGHVIPFFVTDVKQSAGLYRNDKVRVRYVRAAHPAQPGHLRLQARPDAIERLAPMPAGHGEPIMLEGRLALYPQSPQIRFDVWALHVQDADGVERTYTLVNFEDPEAFQAIRAKLADAWKQRATHAIDGRNKQLNPKVRLRASGTLNVLMPNQANPQILLTGPDAVTVELLDP